MSKHICDIHGCDEGTYCASLCHRHYQYIYRWSKAGVAKAMRHKAKLILRTAALDHVSHKVIRLQADNVLRFKRRA